MSVGKFVVFFVRFSPTRKALIKQDVPPGKGLPNSSPVWPPAKSWYSRFYSGTPRPRLRPSYRPGPQPRTRFFRKGIDRWLDQRDKGYGGSLTRERVHLERSPKKFQPLPYHKKPEPRVRADRCHFVRVISSALVTHRDEKSDREASIA